MLTLDNAITFIKSSGAVEMVNVSKEVSRSWKERLFSLPWKPWVKTKTVEVTETRPAIFLVDHGKTRRSLGIDEKDFFPSLFPSGMTVLYHPSLEGQIKESIQKASPKW